ncbi:MAG: glycosyltransferase family 2 protein [Kiritimatiellia bacterium]|nr:glycosyltransferase family 2 protein [Kiritimatiellia bacterium]
MDQKNPAELRGCALIPAYLEERRIRGVVRDALQYVQRIVVIDDGSPDRTAAEASAAGAVVIKHEKNLGKGAALNTGFAYAIKQQCDYLITMDADGQHFPGDIPLFIETFKRTGIPILVGNRLADPKGMPLVRKLTNIFMSWYLSRQIGQHVPDTQCGYRLYAAQALPYLAAESSRYAAESETLLSAAAQNIKIGSVPIKVIYGDEKSKIRPVRDTLRFFAMIRNFRRKIKARPTLPNE